MFTLILQFVGLAAVIIAAGTVLTRYADALGEATGMGRSLAGMIFLAVATSLPELAVDCSAALIGAANLAVGDLLGSCLFNLLILAVLDLLYRSRGPILSRKAAAHALSSVSCMLLATIVAFAVLIPWTWSVWRLGTGTLVVAATYALTWRLIVFDQQFQLATAPPETGATTGPHVSLRAALLGYGLATLVIFAAAPFLARTADRLAEVTGLGGTFVGTLLIAVTTSLPEIVTTRAAVRMGAFDMAVGNIFGSNAFNIAILVPVDLFFAGNLLAAIEWTHALTALSVVVVTAVATLGLLYRSERRVWIIEYDAALVILLVLASYGMVYRISAAPPAPLP